MSAPRQFPNLIKTAEKSAQNLWKIYEIHLTSPHRGDTWRAKGHRLFARCMAADAHIWRLRELQAKRRGLWN